MLWEKSQSKLKTSAKKISDVCSIQEQFSTSSNKEQYSDVFSKNELSFLPSVQRRNKTRTVKLIRYTVKPAMDMQSNGSAVAV